MDYNKIAEKYNERYSSNEFKNIKRYLHDFVVSHNYKKILEAGCGTGMWLKYLTSLSNQVYGCDLSFGMLKQAKDIGINKIILCRAENPAIKNNIFDLIFCINAFHHFQEKEKFISDSYKLLNENGSLVIISVNPDNENDVWYMYQYFNGVLERDLKRFTDWKVIAEWMNQSGFKSVTINEVETISKTFVNEQIWDDKFLLKHNSSQLADLTDEEYKTGIKKIETEIKSAKANNKQIDFLTRITFKAVVGRK